MVFSSPPPPTSPALRVGPNRGREHARPFQALPALIFGEFVNFRRYLPTFFTETRARTSCFGPSGMFARDIFVKNCPCRNTTGSDPRSFATSQICREWQHCAHQPTLVPNWSKSFGSDSKVYFLAGAEESQVSLEKLRKLSMSGDTVP